MVKPVKNVRDLLRHFALKHGVSPDKLIDVWSQNRRRTLALDLSTKHYEERLNWWTEPTLPQGHTLRIEALGQTSYVIITITGIVLLTQPEVARIQRDYACRGRTKVQSPPSEVRQKPVVPTIPPPPPQRLLVSLNKVLKTLAQLSGVKIGVIIVLWNNLHDSHRMQPTSMIPPAEKLSHEMCEKLGLEFPTWKFSGFYFTISTTVLGNGQSKTTPKIIPARDVHSRESA